MGAPLSPAWAPGNPGQPRHSPRPTTPSLVLSERQFPQTTPTGPIESSQTRLTIDLAGAQQAYAIKTAAFS